MNSMGDQVELDEKRWRESPTGVMPHRKVTSGSGRFTLPYDLKSVTIAVAIPPAIRIWIKKGR